jgi:hypothetical protein
MGVSPIVDQPALPPVPPLELEPEVELVLLEVDVEAGHEGGWNVGTFSVTGAG